MPAGAEELSYRDRGWRTIDTAAKVATQSTSAVAAHLGPLIAKIFVKRDGEASAGWRRHANRDGNCAVIGHHCHKFDVVSCAQRPSLASSRRVCGIGLTIKRLKRLVHAEIKETSPGANRGPAAPEAER